MTIEHTPHDADFIDPACPHGFPVSICLDSEYRGPIPGGWAVHDRDGRLLNPDPLTVEPSCCELACYEDPGCSCDGCTPRMIVKPAPDRGLWIGGVFLALAAVLLTLALLAAGGHLK